MKILHLQNYVKKSENKKPYMGRGGNVLTGTKKQNNTNVVQCSLIDR